MRKQTDRPAHAPAGGPLWPHPACQGGVEARHQRLVLQQEDQADAEAGRLRHVARDAARVAARGHHVAQLRARPSCGQPPPGPALLTPVQQPAAAAASQGGLIGQLAPLQAACQSGLQVHQALESACRGTAGCGARLKQDGRRVEGGAERAHECAHRGLVRGQRHGRVQRERSADVPGRSKPRGEVVRGAQRQRHGSLRAGRRGREQRAHCPDAQQADVAGGRRRWARAAGARRGAAQTCAVRTEVSVQVRRLVVASTPSAAQGRAGAPARRLS